MSIHVGLISSIRPTPGIVSPSTQLPCTSVDVTCTVAIDTRPMLVAIRTAGCPEYDASVERGPDRSRTQIEQKMLRSTSAFGSSLRGAEGLALGGAVGATAGCGASAK